MVKPKGMQLTLQDAFTLAARHESAGRRADARVIYEQILDALPDHPGALLKVALQEIDDGRADAAREQLERALDQAQRQGLPTQEIWLALGYAHLARADKVKAREAAERAVLLAPESADTNWRWTRAIPVWESAASVPHWSASRATPPPPRGWRSPWRRRIASTRHRLLPARRSTSIRRHCMPSR